MCIFCRAGGGLKFFGGWIGGEGKIMFCSGLPEFRSFGQKGKFSPFGFRFRPPKVKAEYGRNSRKVS